MNRIAWPRNFQSRCVFVKSIWLNGMGPGLCTRRSGYLIKKTFTSDRPTWTGSRSPRSKSSAWSPKTPLRLPRMLPNILRSGGNWAGCQTQGSRRHMIHNLRSAARFQLGRRLCRPRNESDRPWPSAHCKRHIIINNLWPQLSMAKKAAYSLPAAPRKFALSIGLTTATVSSIRF